jgi:hypothetical protein
MTSSPPDGEGLTEAEAAEALAFAAGGRRRGGGGGAAVANGLIDYEVYAMKLAADGREL